MLKIHFKSCLRKQVCASIIVDHPSKAQMFCHFRVLIRFFWPFSKYILVILQKCDWFGPKKRTADCYWSIIISCFLLDASPSFLIIKAAYAVLHMASAVHAIYQDKVKEAPWRSRPVVGSVKATSNVTSFTVLHTRANASPRASAPYSSCLQVTRRGFAAMLLYSIW